MEAVRYHSYGAGNVLVHEEADLPHAGAGEVVVRVAGAAFNPVDASIRAGTLRDVFPLVLPHTPCYDVAGVIAEVGEGVSGWNTGDAVVAFLPISSPGAAAEYVAAPAELLASAPGAGELADAAAQAGARVTATASARSRDRVDSYGADRIIDYTVTPLPEAVAGQRFDVVLNLVPPSSEDIAQLLDLVVDGGAFANTIPPGPESADRGVRTLQVFGRSDADQLAELANRVDAGSLKINVAQRRPLAELRAVHDEAAAGRLPGKTVLIP